MCSMRSANTAQHSQVLSDTGETGSAENIALFINVSANPLRQFPTGTHYQAQIDILLQGHWWPEINGRAKVLECSCRSQINKWQPRLHYGVAHDALATPCCFHQPTRSVVRIGCAAIAGREGFIVVYGGELGCQSERDAKVSQGFTEGAAPIGCAIEDAKAFVLWEIGARIVESPTEGPATIHSGPVRWNKWTRSSKADAKDA